MIELNVNKQKPNIDLELMRFLPIPVYACDLNGYATFTNELTPEYMGLKSIDSYVGKNIFDMMPRAENVYAKRIYARDQRIMQERKCLSSIDTFYTKTKDLLTVLQVKMPLMNQEQAVIGLFGMAIVLNKNNFSLLKSIAGPDQLLPKYAIENTEFDSSQHPILKLLTPKELLCLKYFVMGYSVKAMACKLNISHRTAEAHLQSVRQKFDCHNKNQLLDFLYSNHCDAILFSLLPIE